MSHYQSDASLQQSLNSAARRWENERAQERIELRQRATQANNRADAEAEKLKAEKAKTAALELKLKEEIAKAAEQTTRADTLQEQATRYRLQALGSFLILADLRSCVSRLEPQPPAILATGGEDELAAAALVPTSAAAADDDEEGEEGEESEEGEEGAAEAAAANGRSKKETANGSLVKANGGPRKAQLAISAQAYDELSAAVAELPSVLGRTELVDACRDGKGRVVESFLSQMVMSDAAEAVAQDALVEALEEGVTHNRGQLIKTLIEHGADAHRTDSLHLAITHGHVGIVAHLVSKVGMSVNTVDEEGRTPLHVAAEANQPKVAQFLLKQSASVDATDSDGCTAHDIAVRLRWKEMQRVLADPSTLFVNRTARATRLYKQGEYELACDNYEAALAHMDAMKPPPPNDNKATFFFNYARAAQSTSQLTRAIGLFERVLDASPNHYRAIDHRAECYLGLGDLDAAKADLHELMSNHTIGVEQSVRQQWTKRLADVNSRSKVEPHTTLGVARFATTAEIRKAYRTACLQYHPDKHAASGDDAREKAKHKFARIQAAYEKLISSAPASRGGSASSASYGSYAGSAARASSSSGYARGAGQAGAGGAGKSWWTGDDGDFDGEEEEEEDFDPPPRGYGRSRWDSGYE